MSGKRWPLTAPQSFNDWSVLLARVLAAQGQHEMMLKELLLLSRQAAMRNALPELDGLVSCIYAAMGDRCWIAAELWSQCLANHNKEPFIHLAATLEALIPSHTKDTNKSLGKFLSKNFSERRVTANGLVLHQCGKSGNSLVWMVTKLSFKPPN